MASVGHVCRRGSLDSSTGPCGMCEEAHHSIVHQRLLGEMVEHISRDDEVMSNNAVASHVMAYDRPAQCLDALHSKKPLDCANRCLRGELVASRNSRDSFIFPILGGSVPGLAELLPLVSIMLVCALGPGAEAATTESVWLCGPKAGQLTVVWTFPSRSLHLDPSFIFLPGCQPSAATATIGHWEAQSSILMKCQTSSVHFNRQWVANRQSSIQTPYRLCD